MEHYHRTAYCSRCDRHYGTHDSGCPLEGVKPECMMTPAELADKRESEGWF